MRSRHAITAALVLGVVTILTVAACGSSVQGSPQANTAALETLSSTEAPQSLPTELTDLSSMLADLPTGIPSELSNLPSELSDLPSDLGDLTNLNIPGYNDACITVAFAYAGIGLAAFGTFGGQGQFDSADLQKSIDELTANVPAEIQPDVQALADVAAQANGKSLVEAGQLFESEKWTTASDNIDKWLDANCGGS